MKKSEVLFGILRVPIDAIGIVGALILSYYLRRENIDLIPNVQLLQEASELPNLQEFITEFILPNLAVLIALAAVFRLYALKSTLSAWQEIGRVIAVVLLWVVVVMGWHFLVLRQLFYSRILLVHAAFLITIFLILGRGIVIFLQRTLIRFGIGIHLVVSVGKHHAARVVQETLKADRRYEYFGHIPSLSALKRLQVRCKPDLVLQTDPSPESNETITLINYCRSHHIGYAFLPPVFADVPHQLTVERLGLVPILRFQPTPLDGWGRVWKRIFDIVVSVLLVIILLPILLFISIIILISNGWPIFYISARVGERTEKSIPVIKFRSMVRDADKKKQELLGDNERKDGPLFKMKNDPRITRIGKLLRRFDIDELPQLFNVIVGQMSLVGPRPHLQEEVNRYRSYERRVFAVKPGITGLSQISGRSELEFKEEVHLDLQYIEEWSLLFDAWILWRTIFVVAFKRSRG